MVASRRPLRSSAREIAYDHGASVQMRFISATNWTSLTRYEMAGIDFLDREGGVSSRTVETID